MVKVQDTLTFQNLTSNFLQLRESDVFVVSSQVCRFQDLYCDSSKIRKTSSNISNLVPLCLLWSLWKERNKQTFEDLDSFGDQLLAFFSGSLFDWSRSWGLPSSDSLPSFLCSLLFCN